MGPKLSHVTRTHGWVPYGLMTGLRLFPRVVRSHFFELQYCYDFLVSCIKTVLKDVYNLNQIMLLLTTMSMPTHNYLFDKS